MTVRSKLLAATYICIAVALPSTPLDAQTDPHLQHLEAEIARLAELAGGPVGVAAIHLETGRRVSHNGGERFGMASTYKVPIAVQLFTRVDAGEISLDSMIEGRQVDLHPGSGTLSRLFDDPGVILSLRNLTELMLLISDNSATDMVLTAAGGGEAVTARMRALGIDGIDVNRPTVHLIGDWIGVEGLPPSGDVTPHDFSELADSIPAGHHATKHDRTCADQGPVAAGHGSVSQDRNDRWYHQRRGHRHASQRSRACRDGGAHQGVRSRRVRTRAGHSPYRKSNPRLFPL